MGGHRGPGQPIDARSADRRVDRDRDEQQRQVQQREVEQHRGVGRGVVPAQAPREPAQDRAEHRRHSQIWGELFEVPLMAAMFLAMVWHARRRVEAQHIAEGRAEERRSMLERQERFIHDASHELRTPLTIARGHLELLRPQGADETELEIALEELGRIDAIIERLLLLATADQPDFLQVAPIDLEPFLEDVFMRWSEVAPRAWRLGQLRRSASAERSTRAEDAARPRAGELRPAEALERIFDRFARVDAARTRAAGGVGLGLAIVDAIAKGHGGHCSVQNTGSGSIFALHLPGFAAAGSQVVPSSQRREFTQNPM